MLISASLDDQASCRQKGMTESERQTVKSNSGVVKAGVCSDFCNRLTARQLT